MVPMRRSTAEESEADEFWELNGKKEAKGNK
jgi:hypothetical protein